MVEVARTPWISNHRHRDWEDRSKPFRFRIELFLSLIFDDWLFVRIRLRVTYFPRLFSYPMACHLRIPPAESCRIPCMHQRCSLPVCLQWQSYFNCFIWFAKISRLRSFQVLRWHRLGMLAFADYPSAFERIWLILFSSGFALSYHGCRRVRNCGKQTHASIGPSFDARAGPARRRPHFGVNQYGFQIARVNSGAQIRRDDLMRKRHFWGCAGGRQMWAGQAAAAKMALWGRKSIPADEMVEVGVNARDCCERVRSIVCSSGIVDMCLKIRSFSGEFWLSPLFENST
jgi:hypothetical protein